MNYKFLIIVLLILSNKINAQDTIIKNNGDFIISKVIEININEVKYKKYSFLDGPVYILNKEDVLVVRFANGVKELFEKNKNPVIPNEIAALKINVQTYIRRNKIEPFGKTHWNFEEKHINEKQLLVVLDKTQDHEIMDLVLKSKAKKKRQYVGFSIFPLAIAAVALGGEAGDPRVGDSGEVFYGLSSGICGLAAIGSIVFDIVVSVQRYTYVTKAVKIYNEKY